MPTSKVKYPCTVCSHTCSTGQASICCDECDKWTHYNCTNLSFRKFKYLSKSSSSYYCDSCLISVTCPCCNKKCTAKQNCIFCQCCEKWLHSKCSSLNWKEFKALSMSNLDFNCDNCYKLLFPYNEINDDELTTLLRTNLYETYSKIESISSNNQVSDTANKEYIDPTKVKEQIISTNSFSFLNINIRSINKNFDKLQILINQLNIEPTVICVTKTWLHENKPLLSKLEGYNFIGKPSGKFAGGSGIFIKKDIEYNILPSLNLQVENCEDLWVELSLNNNN